MKQGWPSYEAARNGFEEGVENQRGLHCTLHLHVTHPATSNSAPILFLLTENWYMKDQLLPPALQQQAITVIVLQEKSRRVRRRQTLLTSFFLRQIPPFSLPLSPSSASFHPSGCVQTYRLGGAPSMLHPFW